MSEPGRRAGGSGGPPPGAGRGARGRPRPGLGFWDTLTEGLGVGLDSLRANKVRSGLTILGVTIGVVVVMVMAAVITGINQNFTDLIASRGPTTFYVSHAPWGGGFGGPLEEDEPAWIRNPPLETRWVEELARLPGIRDVSAYADLGGMGYRARAGSEDVGITLGGAAANFLEIDAGDLIDGRFFTETEDERRRAVAVIDSAAALDLFGGRDPIGQTILVGRPEEVRAPFEVIGVYRPPPNLFAGLASHYVLVPFHAAEKYIDFWDRLTSFIVRPLPDVPQEEAMDVVYAKMRELRGLGPGEEENFALITNDQITNMWTQLTGVLFAVMVALSGVGLMVGGVGVIGIMMISVTERTREIGLRKAMGARRRDILWQFLVEAATLTLVGGAIGLLLGGGLVWTVNRLTPVPAVVPMWSIVIALLVSALTGIAFGLYPAARGARLDPVEALRYE